MARRVVVVAAEATIEQQAKKKVLRKVYSEASVPEIMALATDLPQSVSPKGAPYPLLTLITCRLTWLDEMVRCAS